MRGYRSKVLMTGLVFMAVLFFGILLISSSFATDEKLPTATATIARDGNIVEGNIFNSGSLWYPGYREEGILRLINDRGETIKIAKLGMNAELSKGGQKLSVVEGAGKQYLTSMELVISYNDPLKGVVNGELFSGTFDDLINGAELASPIKLSKDGYVDLKYLP